MLHPDDKEIFGKCVELAHRLAGYLNLTCTIEPKRRPNADGAFGLCYHEEKRISVVLRFKDSQRNGGRWWDTRLSDKDIFETVAHEVAHLVHPNHGANFKKLEAELIQKI